MYRSSLVSLPTALGYLLVCVALSASAVGGQSYQCDNARQSATAAIYSDCGCTKPPVCTVCNPVEQVVTCTSGRAYCDAATMSICGVMASTVAVTRGLYGDDYSIDEIWRYTKGRLGTISYSWTSASLFCIVSVNNQTCTSCRRPGICTDVPPPQSKYTNEANVNCTNLGVGAIATACPFPTYFAGPIPLVESALDVKNGVLAPLAYPYILCQRGLVVIDPNYTAPLPPPTSPTTPTASPPTAPTTTTSENCGLFGLSIICFRGCGFIRRLLGRCS